MSTSCVRLSTLMPVRNGGESMARAITSVLAATGDSDELLVIDDGSTDETDVVAGSFGSRVRYVRSDGAGIVDALNTGLRLARGEFIARCDADDEWLARDVQRQIGVLDACGALACFGGAERIAPDGTLYLVDHPPGTPSDLRRAMLRTNVLVHGSVVFRRDEIRALGGYREIAAAEDYDLWMRLLRESVIATVPDVVYRYHESDSAAHRRKRRIQARSTFRILAEHARLTGEFSGVGMSRNAVSAMYPGSRR